MRAAVLALAVHLILGLCAAGAAEQEPDLGAASIRRGEEIYKDVCRPCHPMKYLGYQALMTPEAGRGAFGRVPPDLSLMASARGRGASGAAYIRALLTGYNSTPARNSVFPNVAMPPPFSPGDPDAATKAGDAASFLYWASDPSLATRERTGKFVLPFMVILTLLLYLLNRETWKGIEKAGTAPGTGRPAAGSEGHDRPRAAG